MQPFEEVFDAAARKLQPLLSKTGFALQEIEVIEKTGTQYIFGVAEYREPRTFCNLFRRRRFIRISTAPLRLELDLDFGIGRESFNLLELLELEGAESFPKRKHDLYAAMHSPSELHVELEKLVKALVDGGKRFVENDRRLWRELRQRRESLANESEFEHVLKRIEESFHAKDWEVVVAMANGQEEKLNKLNLGRLKYAQKKLQSRT